MEYKSKYLTYLNSFAIIIILFFVFYNNQFYRNNSEIENKLEVFNTPQDEFIIEEYDEDLIIQQDSIYTNALIEKNSSKCFELVDKTRQIDCFNKIRYNIVTLSSIENKNISTCNFLGDIQLILDCRNNYKIFLEENS